MGVREEHILNGTLAQWENGNFLTRFIFKMGSKSLEQGSVHTHKMVVLRINMEMLKLAKDKHDALG
ncbi:hypothetical protein H5410_045700, partial [Solanum commersonii]